MGNNESTIANLCSSANEDWYIRGNKIGRGAFGDVYLCTVKDGDSKNSGDKKQTFALKIIDIKLMKDKSKKTELNGLAEFLIKRKISHENIINLFGSKSTADSMYVYMELAEFGSIADLYEQNGPLINHQVGLFTKQILSALSYLHSNSIIHRDIKCQNILLTSLQTIKLSDFGIATVLKKEATSFSTGTGTPHFMAPEVNAGKSYDFSADIWSLGATVLEMKIGGIPNQLNYLDDDTDPLNYYIKNCYISDVSLRFIDKCLKKDPSKRAQITELQKENLCHLPPFTKEEIEELKFDLKKSSALVDELKPYYVEWRTKRLTIIGMLETMVDVFDKFRIARSAAGIASGGLGLSGGIVTIVGLSLAPFTAGASLVLSIVGVAVGSTGGLVASVKAVGEFFQQKKLKKQFKAKIEEERKECEKFTYRLELIFNFIIEKNVLNKLHMLNVDYRHGFQADPIKEEFLRYNDILNPFNATRILGIAADITESLLPAVTAGARAGLRIGAGALNVLLIPLDIYNIAIGIRDVRNLVKDQDHPQIKNLKENLKLMKEGLMKMDKIYKLFDPTARTIHVNETETMVEVSFIDVELEASNSGSISPMINKKETLPEDSDDTTSISGYATPNGECDEDIADVKPSDSNYFLMQLKILEKKEKTEYMFSEPESGTSS